MVNLPCGFSLFRNVCAGRFTRLTLGFSKKIENHVYALAVYTFPHNFCKIHKTLRCTPAMEAGVTDKLWEIKDIVALLN